MGRVMETREDRAGKQVHHLFKTPLWRSTLNLDTDGMLQATTIQ